MDKNKELPPAAIRALQEAEERKKKLQNIKNQPKEINGYSGLEPTRYGDWEKNGLTSDF